MPVCSRWGRVRYLASRKGFSSSMRRRPYCLAWPPPCRKSRVGVYSAMRPRPGVGDADEDDGFDVAGGDLSVCGGPCAPGAARHVGLAAVEEVLAVVEVEDGEVPRRLRGVTLGEIDVDLTLVGENSGRQKEGLETGDGIGAGLDGSDAEGAAGEFLLGLEGVEESIDEALQGVWRLRVRYDVCNRLNEVRCIEITGSGIRRA